MTSTFLNAAATRSMDAGMRVSLSFGGEASQHSGDMWSMWDWGAGRTHDDVLHKIHSMRHVHGDGGAYVGGDWIDIEDCARFNVKNGSNSKVGCSACPRSRSRNTAAKPDGSYDVIIIGAGCIGSAIARELSKTTASVLILEAADDVTQGATKGNSGIIHAGQHPIEPHMCLPAHLVREFYRVSTRSHLSPGFDDKPGSNRAKYCWAGNQMFPQLDRELHFGFQVCSTASDPELCTRPDMGPP